MYIIRSMARDAAGGRSRIFAVRMTALTAQALVGAGQPKIGPIVIESGVLPI